MKKFYSAIVLLFGILLFSCNSNTKEKQETQKEDKLTDSLIRKYNLQWAYKWSCKSNAIIGNLCIADYKAKAMIDTFNQLYGRNSNGDSIAALVRNYYVDSCTIYSIASYLENKPACGGIRIYFGASTISDNSYSDNLYKNKTTIFFYPTIDTLKGHHDDSFKITMPVVKCVNNPGYQGSPYIKDYSSNASSQIYVYEAKYCKNAPAAAPGNYSLSAAVWIDGCVFTLLKDLIKNASGKIDGVNIRMAAYTGNEPQAELPANTKAGSKQSTVILVPAGPAANGTHEDNWEVINVIYKIFYTKGMALNHGELCPQVCN